jgi:hypothetical protein
MSGQKKHVMLPRSILLKSTSPGKVIVANTSMYLYLCKVIVPNSYSELNEVVIWSAYAHTSNIVIAK